MAKSTSGHRWVRNALLGRVALVLGVAACGGRAVAIATGEDGPVVEEGGLDGSLDALVSLEPDGADASVVDGTLEGGFDASIDASFEDGSDGGLEGSFEAAASEGSVEDGSDAANDAGSTDAADAGCGVDGSACSYNGLAGLCRSSLCVPCTVSVDDGTCMAAYGGPSSPYLCLSRACTPGDCRTNGDCVLNPNGSLCGVSTPNLCGICTNDAQCAGNPSGSVCDTSTGGCVAGSCLSDGGAASEPPSTCPVNPSDVCCSGTCMATGNGGVTCCSSDPAANAYCSSQLGAGAQCVNNVCTSCVSGHDNAYTVDPNEGSDGTGNGNVGGGNPESCAFRTITRALQVVGSSPAFAVTVTVVASTVGPGETFPLVMPSNVTLTTLTPFPDGGVNAIATNVTVNVPAGKAGFIFAASPASTIIGFGPSGAGWTLLGGDAGTYGIVVTTGGVGTLQTVNPSGFLDDGILVEGSGVLSMNDVNPWSNGIAGATTGKAGLHVRDNGHAIIYGSSFAANTGFGIQVDDTGYVTMDGYVSSFQNDNSDLWIGQTPGPTIPQNVINGLGTSGYSNVGTQIVAGSNVQIRNSTLAGVLVESVAGSSGSDDISKIDLGTNPDAGGSYGNNMIPPGNTGPQGICLAVQPNSGTLKAEGNIFGSVDCATSTSSLGIELGGCEGVAAGITNVTGNAIDVALCTP